MVRRQRDDAAPQYDGDAFNLQAKELLAAVPPLEANAELGRRAGAVVDCLRRSALKRFVCPLSDTASALRGLSLPLRVHNEHWPPNCQFAYARPASVQLYHGFTVGKRRHCDVLVRMPAAVFKPREYLNGVYHAKRALYLCGMVVALRKRCLAEVDGTVAFSMLHGDPRRPIAIVEFADIAGVALRLIPVLSADAFKASRFAPAASNLRHGWHYADVCENDALNSIAPETPLYSQTIACDVAAVPVADQLDAEYKDAPRLAAALRLLKIWLRRRNLMNSPGCWPDVAIDALVLLASKQCGVKGTLPLSRIVAAILTLIGDQFWQSCNLTLDCADADESRFADYRKHFAGVLLHSESCANLLWNVSTFCLRRTSYEARLAVDALERNANAAFEHLFLQDIRFEHAFDQHIIVRLDEPTALDALHQLIGSERGGGERELRRALMDGGGDAAPVLLAAVDEVLRRGLADRVALVDIQSEAVPAGVATWPTDSPAPDHGHLPAPANVFGECGTDAKGAGANTAPRASARSLRARIGLVLNGDEAARLVDRGPPADDAPSVAEWRAFWGERSELRKFADTSIYEVVVWPDTARRDGLVAHIIRHLLATHLRIPGKELRCVAGQIERVLQRPRLRAKRKADAKPVVKEPAPFDMETVFDKAASSFDALCSRLRGAQQLSLAITNLHCTSAYLRRTAVDCLDAASSSSPAPAEPIIVDAVLESSGKWPRQSADAYGRLMAALNMQLADKLNEGTASDKGAAFRARPAFDCVHVQVKGVDYDLRLHEYTAEAHGAASSGVAASRADRVALSKYLHSVSVTNRCYGDACRLAKRWLSAHMLLGHYVDELLVELIVAKLFIEPMPYSLPGSPYAAFARFLDVLCEHDWLRQPLFVNFNKELTEEQVAAAFDAFVSRRPTRPPMCVITPMDEAGGKFTRPEPSPQMVGRLRALARAARPIVAASASDAGDTGAAPRVGRAFTADTRVYDVLLELSADADVRAAKAGSMRRRPSAVYVGLLRAAYGHCALFFEDVSKFDGHVGVVWRPEAKEKSPHEPTAAQARRGWTVRDGECRFNFDAALEDFRIIGGDLVHAVRINKPIV